MTLKPNHHAVATENLTKKFGDFTAVDHINITIPRGEIFGFLGPNGAGKTTTMRMLLGLLRPTEGTALVLGLDVQKQLAEIRQHIGYMSQKFSLYNDLTVNENLNFYGGVYGVRSKKLRERKKYILHIAGLDGREHELTKNLSGGWKQRLALGTAIIHEPEMLFLDEPTAGVDPISRRAFWQLLYELAEGGTSIFVTTHYMDEAEHCQSLAFIQRGKIVAQGSPQEMKLHQMPGEVLEVTCSQPDKAIQTLRALNVFEEVALYGAQIHVVTKKDTTAASQKPVIEQALSAANITVEAVDRIVPSLEDVFIANVKW